MTQEKFQEVLNIRLSDIIGVLNNKAAEYSRSNDRLHNFKRGAATLQEIPEAYCMQLAFKHVVSILDMIDDLKDNKASTIEVWREKIGDAINYLILLEALVIERANDQR